MDNIKETDKKLEIPILNMCKKGIFIQLPVVIVLFFVYYVLRGSYDILNNPWKAYFIIAAIFIILFILHELMHYVIYLFYTNFDSKKIIIGFDEECLKPYCKCLSNIDIKSFKIDRIAPLLITGILPYIVSVILGNFFLMAGSLLSIFISGVDIAILIKISKYKNIKTIRDNEESYGLIRYHME